MACRTLPVVASAATAALLLAGCGEDETTTKTTTTTTTTYRHFNLFVLNTNSIDFTLSVGEPDRGEFVSKATQWGSNASLASSSCGASVADSCHGILDPSDGGYGNGTLTVTFASNMQCTFNYADHFIDPFNFHTTCGVPFWGACQQCLEALPNTYEHHEGCKFSVNCVPNSYYSYLGVYVNTLVSDSLNFSVVVNEPEYGTLVSDGSDVFEGEGWAAKQTLEFVNGNCDVCVQSQFLDPILDGKGSEAHGVLQPGTASLPSAAYDGFGNGTLKLMFPSGLQCDLTYAAHWPGPAPYGGGAICSVEPGECSEFVRHKMSSESGNPPGVYTPVYEFAVCEFTVMSAPAAVSLSTRLVV